MKGSRVILPDEEELSRRHRAFSRHYPDQFGPKRVSQVPAVIAPYIAELERIEGERASALHAEDTLTMRFAEWNERVAKARAEHTETMRRAVLNGDELPPRFEPEPWNGPSGHTNLIFDRIHGVLEAEELWIMEQRAGELAEKLRRASSGLRDRVRIAEEALAKEQNDLAPYLAALERLEAVDAVTSEERAREQRRVDPRIDYGRKGADQVLQEAWDDRHAPRGRVGRR